MNGQVHRPTDALGMPYWSTKKVLKKLDSPTNPPKVTK